MKRTDRLKSVMIGHAVADALGVPVEFCDREELDEAPVTDMMGYGTYSMPAGSWSDDTSMALATLDSLADGRINYDEIMKNFAAWWSRDEYTPTGEMFDIGGTCLSAIRTYLENEGIPAVECGLSDVGSNGNGSLMRIHPMSVYLYEMGYTLDEAIDIIHNTSALTHAHMRSKIACGIYTAVLWAALDEPSVASVRRGLSAARRFYKGESELSAYNRLFKRIAGLYPSDEADSYRANIKSSGYVVDTLEAAIWCVLSTNDYKTCVLRAVNLGEDTDTVAAIAGGIAGAIYGYEGIPRSWRDTLIRRDYIEDMCERAAAAWDRLRP